MDDGEACDAIYLDFAKAFDKVPFERLLIKVKSLGIRGKVLRWIGEWLRGRKQRVCIEGSQSGWRDVSSGVLQCSVLGPVLFLIYINDIDLNILSWLLKFADDTKLFAKVNTLEERDKMQTDLDCLVKWSADWQMSFNVSKCNVMHIGKNNRKYKYYMYNQELEVVEEERDLGVIITSNLKVSKQCQNAYNKAIKVLGLINRTIKFKNRSILLCLYKSLVRPLLEYCTPAWSPHYIKDKVLLEKAQHRFTRMIPGLKKLDYNSRLVLLGIWTLEERRN